MITASHDALPVRQTATASPKACWRPVGRISVGLALCGTLWCVVSACAAAEPKKDAGPRIVPATKSHADPSVPAYEEARPRRAAKPDKEVPPLPGEPSPSNGRQQAHQMRIIPSRERASAPDYQRFLQIYRSIPYSRLSYQANPRYREELALSLLLNQFPPPPTIMMPGGDSGMGQGGMMSPYGGGGQSGNPMNYGPPAGPLDWMLTVPPQWLF
jgi:hypothetical protein